MISPMFWNLCKSSWLRGLHLFVLGVLIIISSAQDGRLSRSPSNLEVEGKALSCGKLYHKHSLTGGKDAGKFVHLGNSSKASECVDLCCNNKLCKTALFVGELGACYMVNCRSIEACKPVIKTSKYQMSIFKKSYKGKQDALAGEGDKIWNDSADRMLIRVKRHISCHGYHGKQCVNFLDKKRPLYFENYPKDAKLMEKKIKKNLKTLRPKIPAKCRPFAMQAICRFAFPYCHPEKRQVQLCQEDCIKLRDEVCQDIYMAASEQELQILPNCTLLPLAGSEKGSCTTLNIPDSLGAVPSSSPPQVNSDPEITPTITSTSVDHDEDNIDDDVDAFKKKINRPGVSPTAKLLNKDDKAGSSKDSDVPGVSTTAKLLNEDEKAGSSKDSDVKSANDPNKGVNSPKTDETDKDSLDKDDQTLDDDNTEVNSRDTLEEQDLEAPKQSYAPDRTDSKHEQPLLGHDQLVGRPVNHSIDVKKVLSAAGLNDSMLPTNAPHVQSNGPTVPATKHGENDDISDDEKQPVPATKLGKDDDISDDETPTVQHVDNVDGNSDDTPAINERDTLPTPSTPHQGLNSSLDDHPTFVNVTEGKSETNLAQTDEPSPQPLAPTNKPSLKPLAQTDKPSPQPPTTAQPATQATGIPFNGTQSVSSQATTPSTDIPTRKPTAHPTEAPPSLQVSAGDNKVLTLPVNTIELYASAFPKEQADNHYTYHWQQISAPQGSHGYMEGKDTRRVILSKLSHIGTYQFKVTVTAANHAFGMAHVNVTVKPAPRVNKPPRADISPKEQTITLPTNEVVLDGSKSTDDDKIVKYKWEEMKGPLNDKNKMISSGADSPVLQLKSLVPGIYTFKLTVIDSDGETDSTTATVTVNDEKDYPPVARAGNDVILTLPVNHMTMYGNQSTDDKGIVSYEWSKAPSSPAVGDLQGTSSPYLKVSNMVVGDYTFVLKVTDTGGQSAISRVTVVVQPEKNTPPVAKAGSDKDLVYPDDTTTLDAKGSFDDQKIVKYHWEQISGPTSVEMNGADDRVVTVKKLTEGHFIFKLTVTDDKGLTGSDTVGVKVKKDINQAPVGLAGPDVVVHLPNRAAEMDGSKSSDDHGITDYLWTRDPKSPAAGDVINSSNHQAVLRLSNLVEGLYKFKLTVSDAKGLKSSDEALLTVKEDENSAHLVELFLDVDITKFTEENKGQLIRKLAVILDVQDDDIVVEHLKEAGTGHSMMVMFYVKGVNAAKDGQAVAEVLKAKIENEEGFFEFRMLKVEPYICRNNCSFHGYCDRTTKLCVCESFWMQNVFKSSFGVKESNCDWSILYVTVIIFGIIMAIGGIIWAICFCMGRKRLRGRRRHRYAIIDEDDDDKTESMEMLPKGKYSSLMLSDSFDDDSDDETTLFEAKKRVMNGNANGGIGNKHTF